MDIQTSHPNTLQNNLSGSGNGVDIQSNKMMYEQNNINQQIHSQQLQQQPLLSSQQNQQIARDPNEPSTLSTDNISQESTIAVRNIKADPETLQQSGFEQEPPINQQDHSLLPARDGNFVSDIDLGNVMSSSQKGVEEGMASSNCTSDLKDKTSNVNLKSENPVGDFNAFHEQIQTVDPVLLWSMVRSRVVPVVSLHIYHLIIFSHLFYMRNVLKFDDRNTFIVLYRCHAGIFYAINQNGHIWVKKSRKKK